MYSAKLVLSGIATHQGHLIPGRIPNHRPSPGFYGWELMINTGSIYGFDRYFTQEEKSFVPLMPEQPIEKMTDGGLTLEQVQQALEAVIRELEPKNEAMAFALKDDIRLCRILGKEIYFVTNKFMKSRFEKPQPKAAINNAFSRAIGQTVTVQFWEIEEIGNAASNDLVKIAIEELGGQLA